MKTISFKFIIAVMAVMLVSPSCQKEMAGTQDLVKEGETIHVSINAGLGDFVAADATKATATPVVRLTWEDSDKVQAYYGTANVGTDLAVTPSQNKIFAKLSGTITAPLGHDFVDNDIITFVYSNAGTGLTFNFSSQDATIPFVAYATVKWSEIKSGLTDKMVEFKFATSVMKIAATGLDGGDISSATIDGINTKVTLTPQTNSETVTITGNTSGTITKAAGFDASSDKTRTIFTVGLVRDSNTGRKLTINGWEADLTDHAIEAGKSYTTPCAFESSDEYVVMKMKSDQSKELKWAKKNLGASGITGCGELYSWGEVATKFDYSKDTYVSPAKDISGNLTKADGNDKYDVAKAVKGGKWRMPTSQEFQDLYDACVGPEGYDAFTNPTGTPTDKGVYKCSNYKGAAGRLFYDGINELFFPAAGGSDGTSRTGLGFYGEYWSSTWLSADEAYSFYFDPDRVELSQNRGRYFGRSVRPVSD